jgi:hypothetical protein
MNKIVLTILVLSFSLSCLSQSKIVGAWILQDSIEAKQFFAQRDGTIEERTGLATEDIWSKNPRTGKYKFERNGKLTITWSDKSVEIREVKFEDHFNVARIKITNKKSKITKVYIFSRIVDEEVAPDK